MWWVVGLILLLTGVFGINSCVPSSSVAPADGLALRMVGVFSSVSYSFRLMSSKVSPAYCGVGCHFVISIIDSSLPNTAPVSIHMQLSSCSGRLNGVCPKTNRSAPLIGVLT